MSKPAKVLMIDADELDRSAFKRMVRDRKLPWEVKLAETLATARALLTEARFDVIIADHRLPDGESTELLEELPEISFVLVTGTLEEQLALRTLECGADDYLPKDPQRRYLEALPFVVEKTLYRRTVREKERRLTRELRDSEQRLRATFHNAASGIARIDDQDHFAAVNDRLCQMLGYAREELLGKSVYDMTFPDDRPRTKELLNRLRGGLPMLQCEKRYLKRDGSPLWVHVAVSAVRDDRGRYLYSVGTVVDISARKAAQAQVHLQAAALEAAPSAISLSKTDPKGTIVWVNPAFTTLTGYSPKEAVGKSHHLLSSGEQNEQFYRDLWETITRGKVWRGELVNRRKDGTLYYEEMGITPLRDDEGQITHYVAIKQDISARKQAQAALRESQQRFAAFMEHLPAAAWAKDLHGRYVYANAEAERVFSRSLHEVQGKTDQEIFPPETARLFRANDQRALSDGEVRTTEVLRQADGRDRHSIVHKFVVPGPDGKPAYIAGVAFDITERKQAEQALGESEEKFRSLVENMGTAAGIMQGTRFVYVNRRMAELLGYSVEELLTMHFPPLVHPAYREMMLDRLQRRLRGEPGLPSHYEFIALTRSGEQRWFEFWPAVIKYQGQPALIGTGIDITERKQAELALRESEEKYRSLVESMPDHAVMTVDARGRITSWNPGAERIFGWTKEEIAGQPVDVLFTPEDRAAGVPPRELEQARRRGRTHADRWQVRKDGTRFFAAESVAPLPGENGQPPSYVKVLSDATQQKLAERVLRESEKATAGSPASRSALARYGVALVLSAVTLGVLGLVGPLYGLKGPPWVLVSLAVAASAWWGGVGPGLLITAVTGLIGWWAFVPHHSSFTAGEAAEVFRWSAFFATSVAISALAGVMHRANKRQSLSVARLAAEAEERRRMEAAVREQAQMLEQSYDAVLAWPLNGPIRYWNSGAERLYGFTPAEAIGRVPGDLLRTEVDGGIEAFLTALERDGRWSGELRQQTRDGRQVIVESRMVLMPDESGAAGVVLESNRDITERKRMEAALRLSEERYRLVSRATKDVVWDWDLTNDGLEWAETLEAAFGYRLADVPRVITWWVEHVHPEDRERAVSSIHAVIDDPARGDYWICEYRFQHRDGRWLDILDRGFVLRGEEGRGVRMIGSMFDQTERKRAEQALAESESFYRQTLESIPGMVFTTRPDGYCDYQSQQWVEYSGVPMSEHVGAGWNNLLHPDDRPAAYEAWRAAVEGRAPYDLEYRVRRHDGEYEWFKVRGRPIRDSSGQIVRWFGVAANINDLKRTEEALQRGTRNLQILSQTATRLLMADSPKEALGEIFPDLSTHLTMELFFKFLVSEDGQRLTLEAWGGIDDATVLRLQQADVTESVSGVVARQRRAVIAEDVQHSTEPATSLIRSLGLTAYACHPLLARGRLVGTLGFGTRSRKRFSPGELDLLRTVSDQVAMALERKRLVTELEQRAEELAVAKASADAAKAAAERANQAKDHFLAVLSHELRNPLTPVLATAALLGQEPDLSAEMRESLEVIRRNAELEARLIDDLLDVTRIARGKLQLNRKPVQVCTILGRAIEVCQPDIDARRLRFGADIVEGPHIVDADAARMQQVFWNVLKNAIKFTPHGGSIDARCWRENGAVIVEFQDSGIGIEPEALHRIFNAFEQAEPIMTRRFGGLGLGLAISKAIVEMHGGTIAAFSRGKGQGATFTVKLPVHAAQGVEQTKPVSAQAAAAAPVAQAAGLRILLVEDHGDTSRIMARLLKGSGHTVQTAGDVATALQQARTKEFDLLISDLGLPDGSGIDLLNQLRAGGYDYPAIAMTGYGQEEDIARTQAAGFVAHVVKPIEFEQMTRAIAEAAGRARRPRAVPPRRARSEG